MEPIIDPIPVQLIEQELTPDRLLRHTNKADNDIYVVTAHNAPIRGARLGVCEKSPSGLPEAELARRVTSTSLT